MSGADQAGADDRRTLTLRYPVEIKRQDGAVSERVETLTFQRLKGAAARRVLNASSKGAGDFTAALVCECARITPPLFDQLDAVDINAAAEIASDFFGASPPTSSS